MTLLHNTKTLSWLFWPFVLVLWISLQAFLLWHLGIVTTGEATKYTFEAGHWLATGHYSSGNFLFYSVTILLIAFSIKIQAGYWIVVAVQIILNGLSIISFYKITQMATKYQWLSRLATLYFLLFYYYHMYNVFLYTESIFFSLSLIYAWALLTMEKLRPKGILVILAFLLLLYLSRPTGIFFIPATVFYLVLRFWKRHAVKIFFTAGILGGMGLFFLLNRSLNSGGEFDFLLPYIDERIICGVPTITNPHEFHIPVQQNSVQGLFYIVTHHSGLFFRLAAKRLIAFFGAVRSFNSPAHNLILVLYYYLMYLLIIINFKSLLTKRTAENIFYLTNIFLMTVTVALSCDEWSNRFLLSVTSLILLLSVNAADNLINRIHARKQRYPSP